MHDGAEGLQIHQRPARSDDAVDILPADYITLPVKFYSGFVMEKLRKDGGEAVGPVLGLEAGRVGGRYRPQAVIVQVRAAGDKHDALGIDEKGRVKGLEVLLETIQGHLKNRHPDDLSSRVLDRVGGIKPPLFRGDPQGEVAADVARHGCLKVGPEGVFLSYEAVRIAPVGGGDGGAGGIQKVGDRGPEALLIPVQHRVGPGQGLGGLRP